MIVYLVTYVLASFPAIEFTKDRDVLSLWSPLTINVFLTHLVNAVSFVALGDLVEAVFSMELS